MVVRLDQAVRQALEDESIGERMHAFGTASQHMLHAAFAARLRADTARYARIIQQADIKTER
jgi:tripartite-type tricarboxylate transporter receptor subunit TctC